MLEPRIPNYPVTKKNIMYLVPAISLFDFRLGARFHPSFPTCLHPFLRQKTDKIEQDEVDKLGLIPKGF